MLKFMFQMSSEMVKLISNTKMKLLSGIMTFILNCPPTRSVWAWSCPPTYLIYVITLQVKIFSILLSSLRFPGRNQLTLVILAYLTRVATEAFQVVCLVIGLKPLQAVVSAGLANLLSTRANC
ncbi:unnamed protein product [Spirodela intermedia]|uniref:Uncharacterized protein n=1 Tax=Spirodela intermedia TaxID=51605 RepID=A0A7I8JJR2_SPIIN|nr:unnamed protein product [Spirodela intermedia]CAA6670406.1 unnamed protein product [Spirodela intermedia]